MGILITGVYDGSKKVTLTHQPSGSTIRTVAPKDNQGDGSLFSPTDLLAAGLGSCIITTIAIVAEREGINVSGMHMQVEKNMSTEPPRRIAFVPVTVHLPKALSETQRQRLETAGRACPAHRSLSPETDAPISFVYDLG